MNQDNKKAFEDIAKRYYFAPIQKRFEKKN